MEKSDKLESIYDDPAWKEAQREVAFGKLERRLWNVAKGLFIVVFIILAGAFAIETGAFGFLIGLVGGAVCIVALFIISGVLAIIQGFVPIRKTDFDYSMRVLLWVPANIILIMLAIFAYLVMMFFDFRPWENPFF